jgi:hypothetical protein
MNELWNNVKLAEPWNEPVTNNAPDEIWKHAHFSADEQVNNLYNIPYEQYIAMAYMGGMRKQVTHTKLSLMAAFDGRHRSGKSLGAALFGCLWDETFRDNLENRIVQEPKEFMNILDRVEKDNIHGAVILVDEAGVSMSSSDWYERWLKTLGKTMQMFGYLHPVVLFAAPIKDFVDARLRKMFHGYYSVKRTQNDYSTIIPYDVHYSTTRQKYYYPKPKVRIFGQTVVVNKIRLGIPPDWLLDRYQQYEKTVKVPMLKKFRDEIAEDDTRVKKIELTDNQILNDVISNMEVYETRRSTPETPIFDAFRIERSFGVKPRRAKFLKDDAEKQARKLYIEAKKLLEEGNGSKTTSA